MATWEDLDSEYESDKDDADEGAKIVVGLVATSTLKAETESDSEKYVDLMKQQESTLLDLKASEEGLRGFDFICKTYEDKLKFLCQKLQ